MFVKGLMPFPVNDGDGRVLRMMFCSVWAYQLVLTFRAESHPHEAKLGGYGVIAALQGHGELQHFSSLYDPGSLIAVPWALLMDPIACPGTSFVEGSIEFGCVRSGPSRAVGAQKSATALGVSDRCSGAHKCNDLMRLWVRASGCVCVWGV